MTIFLIGLSHHTAPVELRECLYLSEERRLLAMQQFRHEGGLQECVVLATCNRFEVYGTAANAESAVQRVVALLERDYRSPVSALMPHLYVRTGTDTCEHIMQVAAGLDSMVLGEG